MNKTLKVTVSRRGDKVEELSFNEDVHVIKIGKLKTSHICLLEDDRVARMHAVIEIHGDGMRLIDLGSLFGVYFENNLVNRNVELPNKGVLKIGDYQLAFQRGDVGLGDDVKKRLVSENTAEKTEGVKQTKDQIENLVGGLQDLMGALMPKETDPNKTHLTLANALIVELKKGAPEEVWAKDPNWAGVEEMMAHWEILDDKLRRTALRGLVEGIRVHRKHLEHVNTTVSPELVESIVAIFQLTPQAAEEEAYSSFREMALLKSASAHTTDSTALKAMLETDTMSSKERRTMKAGLSKLKDRYEREYMRHLLMVPFYFERASGGVMSDEDKERLSQGLGVTFGTNSN